MSDWANCCVLCSTEERQTRLQHGHCCAKCADRLRADLRAISDLATMAAASLTPRQGTGVMSTAYGSKPPLNVDAVSPELTLVGPPPSATVLDVVESWTKMVRESRKMVPYGPWTARRATELGVSVNDTGATLIALTGFLEAAHEWIISTPDFPLEDYRAEIVACVRALRRWDTEAEDRGQMVPCPTVTDDGPCNYRLYYRDLEESVTCRRCDVTRDVTTLITVVLADEGAHVWADAEAIERHTGVSAATLRRWAARGLVGVSHGRYELRSVILTKDGERLRLMQHLVRRVTG